MYYKVISIPNIGNIQQQIIQYMSNSLTGVETGFYAVNSAVLKPKWTLLTEYLNTKNLLDRWQGVGVSVLNNKDMNIHTDSNDPNRIYALNIPVLNCNNTYTVWYKEKAPNAFKNSSYSSSGNSVDYNEYPLDSVEEVKRLESCNCAFVNVKIPHRGISMHYKPRFLISLRFSPDLQKLEIENFI